jgi:hypothetical protein
MAEVWYITIYSCDLLIIHLPEERIMAMKKITVNLPEDQVEFLQKIAAEEHVTFTDVLRRSINSEKFFVDQEKNKRKVLVEDADHRIREVMRK